VPQKWDVFGILPTDFGQSLVFQLLLHLLKDLWKQEHACVLAVTPLVSIVKDQVEELTRQGLREFAIGLGDKKRDKTFDRVSIIIGFLLKGFHQSVIKIGLISATLSCRSPRKEMAGRVSGKPCL